MLQSEVNEQQKHDQHYHSTYHTTSELLKLAEKMNSLHTISHRIIFSDLEYGSVHLLNIHNINHTLGGQCERCSL